MRNKTMIRKFWVALAVLCMSQVARAQVSEDRYINFTDIKDMIQSAAAHAADGTDVGSGSGYNNISAIYDNKKTGGYRRKTATFTLTCLLLSSWSLAR